MICCPHNRGFTLPELLISVSIIMIIFAFSGINLLRIIPDSSLTEVSTSFMADAKSQQQSAMMGESASSAQVDYSIKIDEHSYTLFKGQVFVAGDLSNYTVAYPDSITATTGLPESAGDVITFSAITGNIESFDPVHPEVYSITFSGPYARQVTIRFNKLGNVYYVNRI